ncbi:P-loop NTPase fold protein [Mesorhizobium sp. LNJC405B00]|uniref:P-loop NTPase fold protein n=1 Tax=Mesorhizobium sp. LNJC405B00 TaxID=1287281 RepID=UPI0004CDDF83|nr:P-loop NTPase fold protein [Mesorhizobium sp. LNJC405B00]
MASQFEAPRWGELAERIAEKLGLDRARSPTLKTTIERGVRYIKVDDEARQLVFDIRALFIGLLAAGQEDRDSIRYGNTASWFVDWLQRRTGQGQVSEMVIAQLGNQDAIFAALGTGYEVQISVSVHGLIEPAGSIAQTTIETSQYEARHLLGAMMLRDVVVDQVRQLFSLKLVASDITDLARTLVDRIMTSPQPNETRANWMEALAPIFGLEHTTSGDGLEQTTSGDVSRLDRFLQEKGINAATHLARGALDLAARMNQSGGDFVEISSSRLFASALRLARSESETAELAGATALARLARTGPFRGIGDVEASFSTTQSDAVQSDDERIEATDNVTDILRRALSMAEIFGRSGTLRLDAIIVALLLKRSTKLEEREERLGLGSVSLSDLPGALLEQIQTLDRPRMQQWYSAFGVELPEGIEATASLAAAGIIFANLRNDSTEGDTLDDKLNVEDEARAFARVAAARQILPPLAFGVFGDWGSGKTFFMRLIHRHVAALANQTSDRAGKGNGFHRQIVQIRFNAWHYAETNLWASLVDSIFGELDAWLRAKSPGGGDTKSTLLDKLATARELTLDSAERLMSQRRQQKLASERVASAERELLVQRGRFAATPRLFWKVVGESFANAIARNGELKKAAATLGLDQLRDDGEALKSALDSLGDEAKRAQLVAKATRARLLGWPFLTLAFLAVVVVPPLAGAIGAWILARTGTEGIFGAVHPIIAQASAALVAIAGAVRFIAHGVRKATTVIDKNREALDIAIEKELKKPTLEVKQAEEQLAKLMAELSESKAVLAATSDQLAEIAREYEGETGNSRLLRFVRDRAGDGLYAKHLGLIATIRKDFTELSALMAAADRTMREEAIQQVLAYDIRVKALVASGQEGGLLTPEEQDALTRSAEIPTTPSPDHFERIVLYIDDLDRCPPKKVVQVLQAVHLLLSFPLFVVVVAVDSRWVSKSLESHYTKLLASNEGEGATAGDYLEKIFQVPYWVRGMSPAGSQALLSSLAAPSPDETAVAPAVSPEQDAAPKDRPEEGQTPSPDAAPPDKPATAEVQEPVTVVGQNRTTDTSASTEAAAMALALTSNEIAYIETVAPFTGRTPRRALRFLNTYRVIKASLDAAEVARLEAGGYRSLMTQLAIVTGSPGLRHIWSAALGRSTSQVDLADLSGRLAEAEISAQNSALLLGALAALSNSEPRDLDLAVDLKHYGEIARRYSFESS